MKNKSANAIVNLACSNDMLEPCEEVALLEPVDNDIELMEIEPSEPLLDDNVLEKNNIFSIVVKNRASTTRRASNNFDSRMDSILVELIDQRIQTKALPIALRKRLMYQRLISA